MDEIIDYMQEILGFSNSTRNGYINALKHYENYNQMTLEELLEEAEYEEDNGVRKRSRKINKRLIGFKNYLCNAEWEHPINGDSGQYSGSTIQLMLTLIKTFYSVYDITTPTIRNIPKANKENIDDNITKEMVRSVLNNISNLKYRAIVLVFASSGIDSKTLRELTWADFVKATEDYHNHQDLKSILKLLKISNEPVIPTFRSTRAKTDYDHIFFMSPEAVDAICDYGLSKKEIQLNDLMFVAKSNSTITKMFSRINDKMGFGYTSSNTRRVFHAHGLRKYFATQLLGTVVDGMMIDSLMIEFMLGHSIPKVTAAYYKKNPEVLKGVYTKVLPQLCIEEVKVRDINSPEYRKLENQLESLKGLDSRMKEVEKLAELFEKELS